MATDTRTTSSASTRAAIRPEHLYKFAGLLFLLALAFHFFDPLSRVLLLAYASAVLAVVLNAVVRHVPLKRGWVAALVGLVVMTGVIATLWFGGSALLAQFRGLAGSLPDIERQLDQWADQLRAQLGIDVNILGARARSIAGNFVGGITGSDVIGLLDIITLPLLVFFGGLFAVAKPNEGLLIPMLRTVPRERRAAFERFFHLLGERLVGWIQGQLIAMLTIGVLATTAFYIIGVPYALLLGVVNGLAQWVPIVGPIAGGIPAVIVAAIDEPMKGVWVALAILAIQQVESQLLTPWVMSKAANVHPFITLFSILLFGGLFGFLGIVMALPLVLLIGTAVQVLWVERSLHAEGDRVEPVVKD